MPRRRDRMLALAGLLPAAGVLYGVVARPRINQWGTTDQEHRATWPGDELLARPGFVWTNAVTIQRPAERVWPWLVQLGQGHGGLDSYDWLENLVGCDIHSADRILWAASRPDPVRDATQGHGWDPAACGGHLVAVTGRCGRTAAVVADGGGAGCGVGQGAVQREQWWRPFLVAAGAMVALPGLLFWQPPVALGAVVDGVLLLALIVSRRPRPRPNPEGGPGPARSRRPRNLATADGTVCVNPACARLR